MPDEPTPRIEVACATAAPSDADSRFALMQALAQIKFLAECLDIPEVTRPITPDEAENFVISQLGAANPQKLSWQRGICWNLLIAARTPEQRLSLERLINALGAGIGMFRHGEAAQIIQNSIAAHQAALLKTEEDRALDRWRGFGSQTTGMTKPAESPIL